MNVTSMKSLSTQEMLDISKRCLVTRRADFDQVSETQGALSLLDRAHQKLERASEQSPEQAEALNVLTMELGSLDLEHDRRVRGIYHLLVGVSEVLDDEELARCYTDLRQRMLPSGLNTTLLRYEEQIAAARRCKDELGSSERDLLARVQIPNGQGTLLDQCEAWWRVAEALDEVWQERQQLRRASGEHVAVSGSSAADLLRARHQWISAMRVLLATLEASPLSEEAQQELLPEIGFLR